MIRTFHLASLIHVFPVLQALDKTDSPLCDWNVLENLAKVPEWCAWIQQIRIPLVPMWQKGLRFILFNAVEHSVLCARAFIHAHNQAQNNIQENIKVSSGFCLSRLLLRYIPNIIPLFSRSDSQSCPKYRWWRKMVLFSASHQRIFWK